MVNSEEVRREGVAEGERQEVRCLPNHYNMRQCDPSAAGWLRSLNFYYLNHLAFHRLTQKRSSCTSIRLTHCYANYLWKKGRVIAMPQPCSVSENTIATDQSSFWSSTDTHWDAHKIGWAVAGGCSILVCSIYKLDVLLASCSVLNNLQTTLISLVTIFQHCRYAQAKSTEMLSLRNDFFLGIIQIQGNSDRC